MGIPVIKSDARKLCSRILHFAWQNKIYWIIPLALTLLFAVLVLFGSKSNAPFVYTLF
jgi:hypothetical protein